MSPIRRTAINLRTSGGLTLEGIVGGPAGESRSGLPDGDLPGVLFCAPEPHLGGTMQSPVVEALVRAIAESGLMTFQFNFRGVGGSEGEVSLGHGQVEDASDAFDVMRDWPGVDADRLAIVGYSYGAGVAIRMALENGEGLKAVVAVSPVLDVPILGIADVAGISELVAPTLFLIGENDGLTAPTRLSQWVEDHGNAALTCKILEGADRSWQDRRQELSGHAATFLAETLTV